MEINIQGNVFDIEFEKTKEYYQTHSLCDCPNCRNFYLQVSDRLPLLTSFLVDFGVSVDRPDELASIELNHEIQYLFAAYTVCGKIRDCINKKIQLQEDGLCLDIVFDDHYIPNEQSGEYFVIGIYNITLLWRLDEPFPVVRKNIF